MIAFQVFVSDIYGTGCKFRTTNDGCPSYYNFCQITNQVCPYIFPKQERCEVIDFSSMEVYKEEELGALLS